MYVCEHICMHVCMYIHTSVYTCIYACVHVCMFNLVYVCRCTDVCTYTRMHACMHAFRTHACIRMYECMYLYVCMYLCTYVCILRRECHIHPVGPTVTTSSDTMKYACTVYSCHVYTLTHNLRVRLWRSKPHAMIWHEPQNKASKDVCKHQSSHGTFYLSRKATSFCISCTLAVFSESGKGHKTPSMCLQPNWHICMLWRGFGRTSRQSHGWSNDVRGSFCKPACVCTWAILGNCKHVASAKPSAHFLCWTVFPAAQGKTRPFFFLRMEIGGTHARRNQRAWRCGFWTMSKLAARNGECRLLSPPKNSRLLAIWREGCDKTIEKRISYHSVSLDRMKRKYLPDTEQRKSCPRVGADVSSKGTHAKP